MPRRPRPWARWPRWRRRAGRSSKPWRRPRARPGWTTTRCAAGAVGTVTSPSPSWRTLSWPTCGAKPLRPTGPHSPHRARRRRLRGEKAVAAAGPVALVPAPLPALAPTLHDALIPLTVPEVRRLLEVALPLPPRSAAARLAWSTWRRRHQARARRGHYRRHL